MTPLKRLGANIQSIRQHCQLSREEVSQRSNVPVSTQREYENGTIVLPFGDELKALAACFGVPMGRLYRGVE